MSGPQANSTGIGMGSERAGRRNASLTGKDGREVSAERVEAAKARLAARKGSRVEAV